MRNFLLDKVTSKNSWEPRLSLVFLTVKWNENHVAGLRLKILSIQNFKSRNELYVNIISKEMEHVSIRSTYAALIKN